jgi:methyltransferase (TIGR00027 family)
MNMDYQAIFSRLLQVLPFINSVIIFQGQYQILYSSEKWAYKSDLDKIIKPWLALKPATINFPGQKYIIRVFTDNRLVATSIKSDGHIVGVTDKTLTILSHIEPDGIIPFVFRELLNILDAIRTNKPYLIESSRVYTAEQDELIEFKNNLSEPIDELNFKKIYQGVPFTARLMAYYRALETKQSKPLLIDPYAERLAGDVSSFLSHHIRYTEMDYPIVRSHYIEENLLSKWCSTQIKSQIVILGAGLDSRAYRFKPLKSNTHNVYEVDVPSIINYKQAILANEQSLCKLIRISADLSQSNWAVKLVNGGFSEEIPTFWLLEGLVYYIERKKVEKLIRDIASYSNPKCQIFVDIMHKSRWFSLPYGSNTRTNDPFSKHLKWGLNIKDISPLFSNLGWDVSYSFADEYDMGRNVGQKAMVFVSGKLL